VVMLADVTALAVSPAEAAVLLGLSRAMVHKLIAAGELPSVKIGAARRIRVDALREYLLKLEREQNQQLEVR
jgi:excisionase family DNA binding protein